MRKPELLSPAGSMESIYAAVANGCDAVYLGGKQFSARQYANNFDGAELEKVCDFCHLRGVKVYITVNTIYKDQELPELLDFVGRLYAMGVDALIMQDLGAAAAIFKAYPDFRLHASTQLTANSLEDARFLAESGFSTVVFSRELSLDELKRIAEAQVVEVEAFVHGALCVCYSGQCLMSSMLGGRSGNRGRCAQPCRLPYSLYHGVEHVTEGHLLSPKDIYTLRILPELIEAGIASFKIEGRMKSPEYVAGVTGIYRKYIDLYFASPDAYAVEEADEKALLQLFNRGGFSEGYFHTHSGNAMMSPLRPKPWGLKIGYVDGYIPKIGRVDIRTREPLAPGDGIEIWTSKEPHVGSNINKASKAGEVIHLKLDADIRKNDVVYRTHDKTLMDGLRKTFEKDTRQIPVYGSLDLTVGKPAALTLWDTRGHRVFVTGDTVEAAQNQPLAAEKIQAQISKTGATPFALESLELTGDAAIYLPVSALNALRRRATDALEAQILKKSKRSLPQNAPQEATAESICRKKLLTVLVQTKAQFDAAVVHPQVETIYFEPTADLMAALSFLIRDAHREGKRLFAALPRIFREDTKACYAEELSALEESEIDGFLVRSPGAFDWAKGKKPVHVDFTMNVFNRSGVRFWQRAGAERICLSAEMNLTEINAAGDASCETLGYGYLPLMVTHQCPIGNFAGGKEAGRYCSLRNHAAGYFLRDRKQVDFPLLPNCKECVCTVLNSKPLFTLKFFDEVLETVTGALRLQFTTESGKEAGQIIAAYGQMLRDPKHPSIDTQMLLEDMAQRNSTKGHYFRGVE